MKETIDKIVATCIECTAFTVTGYKGAQWDRYKITLCDGWQNLYVENDWPMVVGTKYTILETKCTDGVYRYSRTDLSANNDPYLIVYQVDSLQNNLD